MCPLNTNSWGSYKSSILTLVRYKQKFSLPGRQRCLKQTWDIFRILENILLSVFRIQRSKLLKKLYIEDMKPKQGAVSLVSLQTYLRFLLFSDCPLAMKFTFPVLYDLQILSKNFSCPNLRRQTLPLNVSIKCFSKYLLIVCKQQNHHSTREKSVILLRRPTLTKILQTKGVNQHVWINRIWLIIV